MEEYMNTIISSEIISDIRDMNPGCDISDIFETEKNGIKSFEYNRKAKEDLFFKPIPSLDFLYEINENGTIIRNIKTGKRYKIFLDKHHSKLGYYATFINFKGTIRRIMIHSVVAEAWIGPRPKGMEVDHKDRNPHNNDYHNLRYVTHSEQMKNRILSDRIIEQAKANCRKYVVERVMKPIKLICPDGSILEFDSHTSCAQHLSNILNQNAEYVRKCIIGKRLKEYKNYKIIHVSECLRQVG